MLLFFVAVAGAFQSHSSGLLLSLSLFSSLLSGLQRFPKFSSPLIGLLLFLKFSNSFGAVCSLLANALVNSSGLPLFLLLWSDFLPVLKVSSLFRVVCSLFSFSSFVRAARSMFSFSSLFCVGNFSSHFSLFQAVCSLF